MSKCIKCGRELTSAEIPEFYNGMCEKCHREQNFAEYPFKQGINDYQNQIDQLKQQLAEEAIKELKQNQTQLDQQKEMWNELKEWLDDRMEHYNDCLNENVLISSERQEILFARYNQCFETIAQMEYIEKELEVEDE